MSQEPVSCDEFHTIIEKAPHECSPEEVVAVVRHVATCPECLQELHGLGSQAEFFLSDYEQVMLQCQARAMVNEVVSDPDAMQPLYDDIKDGKITRSVLRKMAEKGTKKMKVEVWNGDQSEYLGRGEYVGDVMVYFSLMPDGSIASTSDAETKPENIPEGARLVRKMNPKIVLDNGQVVYGCQVWWNVADDTKTRQVSDLDKETQDLVKKICKRISDKFGTDTKQTLSDPIEDIVTLAELSLGADDPDVVSLRSLA